MGDDPDVPNQESEDQGLTDQALGGMAWIASSSGVQSGLRVLVVAVLARLLVPADFGLMSAALIVVGLANMSNMLGVTPALVQLPEIDERHVHTGFNLCILFGFAVAGIIWVSSPAIAGVFKMPRLESVLNVMAWMFPMRAVSKVSRCFLQRNLDYQKLAGIDVISYGTYGVVGIGLAFLGLGVWSLAWANLAQKAVQSAVLFGLQPHSVRLSFHRAAAKDLLFYGSGFTVAGMFSYACKRGDNFVVGRWLGSGALGIYGRAYGLMNASNSLIGHVINKVFFPAFAKAQDQPERLARAYRRGMVLIALLVLPISIACILLAPELVDVLLGDQWTAVVLPFQIMAAGMVFRVGYKLGGVLATGTGAIHDHAWRKAVQAFLIVGGAWLTQRWGVPGVACSTLAALALFFVLNVHLALKVTKLSLLRLARSYRPAFLMTIILSIETWGLAVILRSWAVPSFFVLVICGLLVVSTALGLIWMAPRVFAGREGVWFLQKIIAALPVQHLSPVEHFRSRIRNSFGKPA